jgi:predicted RNA binding protein YcfA (HicA-like mRNA interferase family)
VPKLLQVKSRQVEKVLIKLGFGFIRQKGSHKIFVRDGTGITVPSHSKNLKNWRTRVTKLFNITRRPQRRFQNHQRRSGGGWCSANQSGFGIKNRPSSPTFVAQCLL